MSDWPKCALCNLELVSAPASLEYLGHSFDVELPQCPQCGQLLIEEKLVKERIAAIEMMLEDK